MSDYVLTLEFDSDEPEFTRGYECGVLYARLDGRPSWNGTYHSSNAEMIRRIAEAHGYSAVVTPTADPTWVTASFVRYGFD